MTTSVEWSGVTAISTSVSGAEIGLCGDAGGDRRVRRIWLVPSDGVETDVDWDSEDKDDEDDAELSDSEDIPWCAFSSKDDELLVDLDRA